MTLPLPSYFTDFLQKIRPTPAQRADMIRGHSLLRERLQADAALVPGFVGMFLQGSYKRRTAVRPKDGTCADVDLVVVTRMKESEFTPERAMKCFEPFLRRHYAGKYRQQGRSFGIEMSTVEMDLVVTAAPTEAEAGIYSDLVKRERQPRFDEDLSDEPLLKSDEEEEIWRMHPLRIPDSDAGAWQSTHPLAQLRWTNQKNARTSGHFVNVVKALKWWRLVHLEELPGRPKSYPLEHLLGDCCPDDVTSVAEGVVRTLEVFQQRYAAHVAADQVPYSPDRGVDQNVMARISGEDFTKFHARVSAAAKLARRAFESQDTQAAVPVWRELFGEKFPNTPEGGGGSSPSGGFTRHQGGGGSVGPGRFA
ncbi:nucleotidyltransferase [Corallococcus sp. BB11-1]|uniref:SMODS domain-containing nucleotidyltransferase n=1 Tax=Corallococcus sp. BB11-1 TaxID=2996783 RepID=UPI0010D99AD6|nr:nucleotidyltransferase [Corallococcus sp. BB11-1]MCY1036816.1 nucleotidyltransferase [Corallococcus sp. BB11-1]RYZ18052.1 MAG: nucleotidyltransferase [Myxococcaceae bacterium]